MNHHSCKRAAKRTFSHNGYALLLGLVGLFWFLYRTGTKPSRILYPCQRAALVNSATLISSSIPFAFAGILARSHKLWSKKRATAVLAILLLTIISTKAKYSEDDWSALAVSPNQELSLQIEHRNATVLPASDIFVANGRAQAHVQNLIDLMGSNGLLFFRSNTTSINEGPSGLIAHSDVVLIKINEEWAYRGGTNTDVLKELIQAIVNHPDGFVGEIIVADNGQWGGSMNWAQSNAEDTTQSTQDVVDMFSSTHNVSTYNWMSIISARVNEYSAGDIRDGYVVNDTADAESGLRVTYPKFRTLFGTYVSFKLGIWNGTAYDNRLKIINLPVLKSHSGYGVTAAVKHYMGVQSESRYSPGLGNGHSSIGRGGMGTLMAATRIPTLNIIDAIWVNANPPPSGLSGPDTPYYRATRLNILAASIDPIALDYWASKRVLVPTAKLIGYTDTHTLDPDSYDIRGVANGVAFATWLRLSRDELGAAGYSFTADENHMNVHVYSEPFHDIAVNDVQLSKTIVAQGDFLNITAFIQNQDGFDEQSSVTVHANDTPVSTEEVTLPSKNVVTTDFVWNTTGFAKGYYNIRVEASAVPNETDTSDNTRTAVSRVLLTSPGHDIAVRALKVSQTVVGQGLVSNITTTALNIGKYAETFNIEINTNTSLVKSQTVSLESGTATTLTLTWNSSGLPFGNYTISVWLPPVSEELDATDNNLTYSWISVSIVGDVYGAKHWPDGKVDIRDLAAIAKAYGAFYPTPRYNSNFDIIYDGLINIVDISKAAENYGKTTTR